MWTAIKFFFNNLTLYQIGLFGFFLSLHIMSNVWHLDAEKHLAKSIPKILANNDDNEYSKELMTILLQNIGYLIIYAITMFIIEAIGKMAIRNAVNDTAKNLLETDLTRTAKKDYERNMTSIVHHSDNVSSAIRNLFIDFPKKIVACHHFLVALKELSFEIMLYSIMANVLFVLMIIGISYIRKHLLSKITNTNINFSIVCSDVSNSIQTYKVDDRINEYQNKINNLTYSVWYNSSLDSLMMATSDSINSFSSQFMLGLISYMCRPLVLSKSIGIEDLMYGVRSSSKFIEKLIGVVDYFGDVIRQYGSFDFFVTINQNNIVEKKNNSKSIRTIDISLNKGNNMQKLYACDITKNIGQCIRISGSNGVGKTTLLLKFLGVYFNGATTNGIIIASNDTDASLESMSYRNLISFVQQSVPITYDSIEEYIIAVSKSSMRIDQLLIETLEKFNVEQSHKTKIMSFINSINIKKSMRELSGGQSKFIQILAAIAKLYTMNGSILILDEPSNNLDTEKVNDVRKLFELCMFKGITIIMVTHDNRMLLDGIVDIKLE